MAKPVFLDLCREREQNLALFLAALNLAHFRCNQQPRPVHSAFAREQATPSVHEGATQRSRVQPHGNLIGKACKDTTLNRSGLDLAGLQIKTFIPSNCEKLL